MADAANSLQSKNWPDVKWRKVEQPELKPKIRLPKIEDLPISKECALSKPLRIPHVQRTADASSNGYSDLSCLLRMDLFPGEHVPAVSDYTATYGNPHLDPLARRANSTSHRRRSLGFTKRLEHDLAIKRVQAAWTEFYATQPPLIDWEARLRKSAPIRTAPMRKTKVIEEKPKRRPPPAKKKPPAKDEIPTIPDTDLGDMDIFKANKTPDWARDADSIPEELDRPASIGNEEFWAFYDDPF